MKGTFIEPGLFRPGCFYFASFEVSEEAKRRGSMPRSFYFASFERSERGKTKGLDAPQFLF
jgi:hypothetical protein